MCEACDGGYEPDLGPICGPCAPAGSPDGADLVSAAGRTLDRLCVFELALSCGHRVTMAVTGWYPVSVACCDRLGGTVLRGRYVSYFSQVDYVRLRSERYRYRSKGVPRRSGRLLDRQPRTDEPRPSPRPGDWASSGRFPARVGATWSLDGSAPSPPPR
ncbi:hypothetical protein ACN28G_00355 [Micromonospora sp. WMMA1923]|uniref:hypothetical protein n=1 Tax=Micromonospora sp. WMMA1923 TaxID=3404125 RepID=UPI003B951C96